MDFLPRGGRKGPKKYKVHYFIIAVEGDETEREYFQNFTQLFDKRFVHLFDFTNITQKDNSRSAPLWKLDELVSYCTESKISLKSPNHSFYLILDTDANLDPNHAQNTWACIQQCMSNNIDILWSNPCFELWLIAHLRDFSQIATDELNKIYQNAKLPKERDSYLKKAFKLLRAESNIPLDQLPFSGRIELALANMDYLGTLGNGAAKPPIKLFSEVGKLYLDIRELIDSNTM